MSLRLSVTQHRSRACSWVHEGLRRVDCRNWNWRFCALALLFLIYFRPSPSIAWLHFSYVYVSSVNVPSMSCVSLRSASGRHVTSRRVTSISLHHWLAPDTITLGRQARQGLDTGSIGRQFWNLAAKLQGNGCRNKVDTSLELNLKVINFFT